MKKTLLRLLSVLLCAAMLPGAIPSLAEETMPAVESPAIDESTPEIQEPIELTLELPDEAPDEPSEAVDIPESIPEAPTDAADPLPEETEVADPIDYASDAGRSPAFVQGYAQVIREGAVVYASEDPDAQATAELGEKSVVYVSRRCFSPDRLAVSFNADPEAGLDSGWMDASALRPLNPEVEIPSYREFCESEPGVVFYQDDAGLPLNRIKCNYLNTPVAEEETTTEAAPETDAEPDAETDPETDAEPDTETGEDSSADIPDESIDEPIPLEDESLPVDDESIPAEGESLPVEGESIPVEDESLPAEGESIPTEDESIPAEGESLPVEGESIPVEGESIPVEGESIPVEDESLPAEDESLPAEDESIPAEGESIPAIEDVPMLMSLRPATAAPEGFANPEKVKLKMGKGDKLDLLFSDILALTPENAQGTFTFKTSNKKVAIVDDNLFINAKAAGKATVRVRLNDIVDANGEAIEKDIAVTVYSAPKKVTLKPAALTLAVKESAQLTVAFPKKTYSIYTITSSDPSVVSVDENGLVTALKDGSATITIKTQNGKKDTTEVTVLPAPTQISASESNLQLGLEQTHKLSGVYPDGTLCSFTYTSDHPEIVSVAADGKLTALQKGSARITISSSNSNAQAYCDVQVTDAPKAILTEASTLKLGKGNTYDLLASGFIQNDPADSRAAYKFKSSNKKYVTVSSDGIVKGVKKGSATITVTAHNGASAKFKVSVYNAPKKISISPAEFTLGVEMTGKLNVSFPSGTYSLYTLQDYDPKIISVDEYGNIRALKAGSTAVTVVTANGKKAACSITVLDAPKSISAWSSELTLSVKQTGVRAVGVYPDNTMCSFHYTSADESIAKVDAKTGEITAVKAGETKIIIHSETSNPTTAEVKVKVVPAPERIEVAQDTLKLGKGESYDLLASGLIQNYPEGSSASYKFKSSNKKVATISADGIIKAKKNGTVTITVTAHNGVKDSFKVKVLSAPKKITLKPAELTLGVEMTSELQVSFPSKTYSSFTISNSNPKAVSIDANGIVTALSPGSAVITATTANGKSDSCTITVLNMPTKVSMDKTSLKLSAGMEDSVKAICPENTLASFSYASSDPKVVEVNAATGVVKAVGAGSARITATANNSIAAQAVCDVTIVPAPERIEVAQDTLKLGKGESYDLVASGLIRNYPEGSSASYKFKSSNKKVATISADGIIKAKKNGTVTITVTAHNGVKDSFKVKVLSAPKKITLKPAELTLGVEMTSELQVSFPSKTYSSFTISNSNPKAVSIDANGIVTALSPGSAVITATTANGKSDSCTITVLNMPTKVSMDKTSLKLSAGMEDSVKAVCPENTLASFSYASSDPKVIEVNAATGVVKAVGAGSARITATANNSIAAQAICDVTIVPAPKALVMESSTLKLGKGNTYDLLGSGFIKNDPEGSSASYKFKSSNKKYVTVSADGIVKGVKKGSATITVTAHNGVSAKFKVSVYNAPSKISISQSELALGVGMSDTISVKFPSGSYSLYTLKDYDSKIISVDEYGKITALKEGSTVATVVTENGLSASCKIFVLPAPKSISLNLDDVMGVGMQVSPAYMLYPEGSLADISYSVVSGDAVKYNSGMIQAVKAGSAVVRVSTHVPGVYAERTILVKPAPSAVTFSETSYSVTMGETLQVTPSITKGSATSFSYKIKNPEYFEISSDGVITPLKRGTTTLTVSTHNGLSASTKVQVIDPYYPEELSLTETPPKYLNPGETYTPKVSVLPKTASPDLVWSSSAKDIAVVDASTGEVFAKECGKVVITGTSTRNTGLSVSFTIVVLSNERILKIPDRRSTDTGDISNVLAQIRAIRNSAYDELAELYAMDIISKSEYNSRKGYVERAFDMHLMPWMTETKELYWKAANSEDGAKDYKPGIVYYGLPYTQTNRRYNKSKAISNGYYSNTGNGYYLLNGSKFTSRNYPGNDCSSFVSMAIWGMNSSHSFDNTRDIASTSVYKTISDWGDLRPGDVLNKGGNHAVMFLYYANDAKTQIMIIEQGGGEAGTNTISCSIRNVSYYTNRSYKIRRVASLG